MSPTKSYLYSCADCQNQNTGFCEGCVLWTQKEPPIFYVKKNISNQTQVEKEKTMGKNNVEHPTHYNRENAMECIDEMLLIFGKEMVEHFCLCNAWKYRYRAADKNGAEDLAKSDWYLAKYKELRESRTGSATCYIS
jgi:hypothetical protein